MTWQSLPWCHRPNPIGDPEERDRVEGRREVTPQRVPNVSHDEQSGGIRPRVWIRSSTEKTLQERASTTGGFEKVSERIGIVTGGGDCPGLNAVIPRW